MKRKLGNFIKQDIKELIGLNNIKIFNKKMWMIIWIKIYILVIKDQQIKQLNSMQKVHKNMNQLYQD